MLKQDYIDIAIIIGFGLFLAAIPSVIGSYTQVERDEYRGCVASAYQAESRGFNLEDNLRACDEYKN
jgi:hypothetical protein